MDNRFVLIHSPLVGPLTWSLVAAELRQRGLDVLVPRLEDSPASREPFWKQHADSIKRALAEIPNDTVVTLVAHSGAGPLLPVIRESIAQPVNAYVFVDAGLPHNGVSRLDMMRSENAEWAGQLQEELERGGRFPTWSFDDLEEIIPDASLRRQMIAELRPRDLNFFTEPIPVLDSWPDAPCAYVYFSPPYAGAVSQARQSGWRVYELPAGHFHMLVEPEVVAGLLVDAANEAS